MKKNWCIAAAVIAVVIGIIVIVIFALKNTKNSVNLFGNMGMAFSRAVKAVDKDAKAAKAAAEITSKRCFSYYTVPRKKLFDRGGNPQNDSSFHELKNVTSGKPDMSMTLKECEEYGKKINKWWGKKPFSNIPSGCFQNYNSSGLVHYNTALNNGVFCNEYRTCLQNNKLRECQGDCDNDDHCQGNLKCFQRSGYQGVPGCSGRGKKGHDYCYMPEPPLVSRGLQPQKKPGFKNNKLKECEGDCDNDDHCEGNLKCFQRNRDETVPGCRRKGSGDIKGYDYCYNDERLGNSLSLTEKQCKTMAGSLYGGSDRWDNEPTGCFYQPKGNKYYYNKNRNSRVECSGKSQCVKGVCNKCKICNTDVTNDVKKVLEQPKTSSNSSSDSSKNSFACTQCKSLLSVLEPTIVILYKWYVEKVNGKALGKALKSFVAEYPAKVLSKGYSKRFIEDFKQSDFWTGFKENFMKDEDNEQKKALETMGIINRVQTQIKKKVLELLLECVKKSGKAFFDLVRDKNVPKFAHRFCRCLIIEFVRQSLMYVTQCTAEGACEPKMDLFYMIEDELDLVVAGVEEYVLPHVPQYQLVKGIIDFNNERRANMNEYEKYTEDQVRDGALNIATMGSYGIVKGGLGLVGITWL